MKADDIAILDDEQDSLPPSGSTWRIAVIDDDAEVHHVTRLALRGVELEGRPLELLHASTEDEAIDLLRREADIAVVLLDVVMEQNDTGLTLVRRIRDELQQHDCRIILRTGQAGYAPEMDVIRDYDINDYRQKSELTRTRLLTSLTTAVRGYRQIIALRASEQGLEYVMAALSELLAQPTLPDFNTTLLAQLQRVFQLPEDGLVCARLSDNDADPGLVLAASGQFSAYAGRALADLDSTGLRTRLQTALSAATPDQPQDGVLIPLGRLAEGHSIVAYFATETRPGLDQRLLDIFGLNVCLGLDKLHLVDRLRQQIHRDALTQLGTWTQLKQDLKDCLEHRVVDSARLYMLDLDDFARLNETLGYPVGDQVLIAVAERLQARFPTACSVARQQDVFGLLINEPGHSPDHLLALFEEPFIVDRQTLFLSGTVGYTDLNGLDDGEAVFRFASMALKTAKEQDPGSARGYDLSVEKTRYQRFELLADVQQGLTQNEFFLEYQPHVDQQGRLVGAEALVRWQSPSRGRVPPLDFIPLTESTGLIRSLGRWVLDTACAQFKQWRSQGLAPPYVSVNTSALELRDPHFADQVLKRLSVHAMTPAELVIEVTESAMAAHESVVLDNLKQLHQAGIGIAVDDFGTGYSSLAYLKRLPISALKIDQTFVRALPNDPENVAIVAMICQLAENLGLKTIVEGVETREQLEALREYDALVIQGFHFGRPMSAEHWTDYCRSRS